MAVITVGGQIGAGANKIGLALAAKLGYEYHNRSVIRALGQVLETSPEDAWRKGFHVVSAREFPGSSLNQAKLWLRTGGSRGRLSHVPSFGICDEPYPYRRPWHEISDEEYVRALEQVFKALASADNVVIHNRFGSITLMGSLEALHVGLFASKDFRIQTGALRLNINTPAALHRINVIGPRRRAAFRRLFQIDLLNTDLYDLVIHTDDIGVSEATDLISSRIDSENRVLRGSAEK